MTPDEEGDEIPLFFQEVDKFDLAVLAEVPLQLLLVEGLEVFNVSYVHISRGARVDGERKSGGKRARVLTPADLQPTVVQGHALEGGNLIESHGSSGVDEGNELPQP